MKLLIASDGSECSDAAIVDLRRAGLPAVAQVLVLSVAEMSAQLAGVSYAVPYGAVAAGPGMFVPETVVSDAFGGRLLQEAQSFASQGADRLRADFPCWTIKMESWVDSAGAAIIRKTHAWNPDLVVVGSHGRSGFSRFVLGSVSQHVMHHVNCSVRISRHRLHSQERAIRLLIGADGSCYARAAARAVASRNWPIGTEARVVGVLDEQPAFVTGAGLEGAIPTDASDEGAHDQLSKAVHATVQELTKAGLHATPQVLAGRPANVLLAEAENWAADSIFVGARGRTGLARLLLGSVSTEVASRAHCSVEIVRPPAD